MLQKHGAFDYTELHKLFNDAAYSDYVVVFLRLITSSELKQGSTFYENFIDGNRSLNQFCKQVRVIIIIYILINLILAFF